MGVAEENAPREVIQAELYDQRCENTSLRR